MDLPDAHPSLCSTTQYLHTRVVVSDMHTPLVWLMPYAVLLAACGNDVHTPLVWLMLCAVPQAARGSDVHTPVVWLMPDAVPSVRYYQPRVICARLCMCIAHIRHARSLVHQVSKGLAVILISSKYATSRAQARRCCQHQAWVVETSAATYDAAVVAVAQAIICGVRP